MHLTVHSSSHIPCVGPLDASAFFTMNPNFNPAFNLHPPPLTTPVLAPGFHGFQPNPPAPLAGLDPANPAPPVLTARQQYAINHQQVLATVYGRRILAYFVLTLPFSYFFHSLATLFYITLLITSSLRTIHISKTLHT